MSQKSGINGSVLVNAQYIKDLSFENLQDVSSQNFRKDDVDLSDNIKAIFQTYNEKNFSVLLKYNCDCTFKKMGRKVFILEIDYFGLFEINERELGDTTG